MAKHVLYPGAIELPESGAIVVTPPGAADLSALNASNLNAGTVPLARIVGLTDAQIAVAAAIAWSKVSKAGSSLADLATRSASDLSSGAVPLARLVGLTDAQVDVAAAIAWSKLSKAGSSLADLATRSAADLAAGNLAVARLGLGVTTKITDATTGTVANWAPAIAGDTYIEWSGAADATLQGLTAGSNGQRVLVRNAGTKVAYFPHQSVATGLAKFRNIVASGPTPIAAGGFIEFLYNGTDWVLVAHQQGAAISPAYNAGDFTADVGTWTVDNGGDVLAYAWVLRQSLLYIVISIQTSSVAGTPGYLKVNIPNGFTPAKAVLRGCKVLDNGVTGYANIDIGSALGSFVRCFKDVSGNPWTNGANLTYVLGDIELQVN